MNLALENQLTEPLQPDDTDAETDAHTGFRDRSYPIPHHGGGHRGSWRGNDWWPFLSHIPFGDKVGHVGLFGTLSLLCNLAFPNRRPPTLITKTTLVLLAIISLEEISQAFIPGRTLDLFDWLADLLGLACGQTLALAMLRKLRPSP